MAKSILQTGHYCYLCKRQYNLLTVRGLEEHHIWGGPLRGLSERNGLKVWLCHKHHNEPPDGVHFSARTRALLRADARARYDAEHGPGSLCRLLDWGMDVFGAKWEDCDAL